MRNIFKLEKKDSFLLAICWIVLFLVATLIAGRTVLHSDSLFLDDLFSDIIALHGHWRDWKITPAPAYMPDMLLYFIAYYVLPSALLRIVFVSVFQTLLLGCACVWFCKSINSNFSKAGYGLILFSLTFVTAAAANSSMWLYFNSTNNHFASLLLGIISLGLMVDYLEGKSKFSGTLLTISVAIGKASTAIFTIGFVIPALVMLTGGLLLDRLLKISQGRGTKFFGGILYLAVGLLVARLIDKCFIYHDSLTERTSPTLEAQERGIHFLITGLQKSFALDNLWTCLLSVAILSSIFITVTLIFRSINLKAQKTGGNISVVINMLWKNWKIGAISIFFFICLPLNVIGAVASGGFQDPWGIRYFMLPIAVALMVCIITVDEKLISLQLFQTKILIVLFLFCLSVFIVGLLSQYRDTHRLPWQLPATGIYKYPEHEVAACLEEVQRAGYSLHSGIADFWMARGLRYRISSNNKILAVLNNGRPFFHMTTLGPLKASPPYGFDEFNFAILNNSGRGGQFDFTSETIGKLLPPDHDVYLCRGTDYQVWIFNGKSLDETVRRYIDSFLFEEGEGGKIVFPAGELPGQIGRKSGASRLAEQSLDRGGALVYGPYINLKPGLYNVTILYREHPSSQSARGHWDIGRFNDPANNKTLQEGFIEPAENGRITSSFIVPAGGIDQLEVRCWYTGSGSLRIDTIYISKAP